MNAEILREFGDVEGAIDTFSVAFSQHRSVGAYRRLLTEADLLDRRAEVAAEAVSALRVRVDEGPAADETRRSIATVAPSTALIDILLYEGESDAAWEAATTFGAPDHLWMTLTRAWEHDHPGDVIPIYE